MALKAAVLMGSDSDLPKIQKCIDTLKQLGVETTVRVMSAHRTPEIVCDFAEQAASNGYGVLIAAAGGAAHLAGAVAAHTLNDISTVMASELAAMATVPSGATMMVLTICALPMSIWLRPSGVLILKAVPITSRRWTG